ncbi:MAG: L-glyceraldehyde 3-phosphate reductase [Lachnospiraceae bacterium]
MYKAKNNRYEQMQYLRCGRSGIKLPRIALGLWHNFGSVDSLENMKDILFTAFDNGITHFDMANNYGPVPGSAEENFGRILKSDLKPYRDEMILSSKAGYLMWDGPYGDWGSRKYLMASIDQSLQRTGLEYFDIFYHHRPDPETPLEETMQALTDIVKQGKALYVGLSNYNPEQTKAAADILRRNGTPCLIHQPRYNMFDRRIEQNGLLDVLEQEGIGSICFSPLDQGLLTDRYLHGIPEDSRASKGRFLTTARITEEYIRRATRLNEIAHRRGQSLSEMALAWILRNDRVTTVLIGASRSEQLLNNLKFLGNLSFSEEELAEIEQVLA